MTQSTPQPDTSRNPRIASRRGSVVVIVLWAISLGAIIVASVQFGAQRQANAGLESVERVRARWAARAGVERMIGILEYHTETPDTQDAFAVYRDMAGAAYTDPGDLNFADYAIEHYQDDQVFSGPLDEHTRFNINRAIDDPTPLLNIGMPQDVVDATVDWIDEDEDVTGQGAESAYYLSGGFYYQPRNSYMRSIAELELVVGAYPEYVRDEEWNLNNQFDANENDGTVTQPEDDVNGVLDRGWSEHLTAVSVAGGLGSSGLPRIYMPEGELDEVRERTQTSEEQAEALLAFGTNAGNRMSMLWLTPINYFDESGNPVPLDGQPANDALPLDTSQLMLVFSELTMDDPDYRLPGTVNINTAPEELLRDVLLIDPAIVDQILSHRSRSPQGFVSLVELVGISPLFTADVMADMVDILDVNSNVFTITSTGYSRKTDAAVQLIVVVDRSTLPVRILEYREE